MSQKSRAGGKKASDRARFGLAFQASQPFSYYVKCVKLAQKYKFEMFQVYDDLLFKPAWPVLFSVLPYVSTTSNLRLGPGVVNPFHTHPSLIATNLACFNEETNGRSFLIMGRGAFHDLFRIEPKKSLTALKESIVVIDNICSRRAVEYDGEVFKSKAEAQLRWMPERNRRKIKPPELWIGTWGQKTAEAAGAMRRVKGLMISSITDPRYIKLLKERTTRGAKSVGRDPSEIEIGVVIGTIVSPDRDRAYSLAKEASAVYLPYLSPMTEFVGVKGDEIEAVKEALSKNNLKLAAKLVSERSVNSFKLWGTPDDIIEKTEKILAQGEGASTINYGFGRGPEDIEAIELLGKKVLPYFRK